MPETDTLTDMEQQALVLIRRGECRYRAELSRSLGISRPTASQIADKLLAVNALRELGTGKAVLGRSPMLLSPSASYQYTIGLDLGYTKQIVGVLIDGKNQIIRKAETDFDRSSVESIRENSLKLIRQLQQKYPVTGVGIALSGIVEPETGTVLHSVNPLFTEYDIPQLFTQWTQLPSIVENRSRSAAFSEAYGGAADRQKNFILCSLGKSIGAAFWLNGAIFPGAHGAAGEIRFIRLADGRTLEDALAIENIPRYTEDELVSICSEGLHQLTEVMDLELFVLTGRFTDFSAAFLKKLSQKLSICRKCQVVFSNYGRFSAARGVAIRIAENMSAINCALPQNSGQLE